MNSDLLVILILALLIGNQFFKLISKYFPLFEWVSGYRREAKGALFLGVGMLASHFLIYLPLEIFGAMEVLKHADTYWGWRALYWAMGIACFIGVPWALFSLFEKLRPWWAETQTWLHLKGSLRGYATILHRRCFLQKENYSMELDLLIVCTKGVFVMEVKAAQGVVHGEPKSKQWVQTLGSTLNPVSHNYRNPLFQNMPKARELSHILKHAQLPTRVQNLVYFSHAKLEIEPPSPYVFSEFAAVLKYIKSLPVVLTLDEVKKVNQAIELKLTYGPKARERHMELVQAAKQRRAESEKRDSNHTDEKQ